LLIFRRFILFFLFVAGQCNTGRTVRGVREIGRHGNPRRADGCGRNPIDWCQCQQPTIWTDTGPSDQRLIAQFIPDGSAAVEPAPLSSSARGGRFVAAGCS